MTKSTPINPSGPVTPSEGPNRQQPASSSKASEQSFADALSQAQGLKFSNHAQKRLQKRDITLSDDGLNRLANAVQKAEKRGSRDSLVLMDEMAFIVNVKERLVVTALDSESRGEGVFTQIDTVVFADTSSKDETGGAQSKENDKAA
jgi:flagellar operon protein